jgi:hypothetical protein
VGKQNKEEYRNKERKKEGKKGRKERKDGRKKAVVIPYNKP